MTTTEKRMKEIGTHLSETAPPLTASQQVSREVQRLTVQVVNLSRQLATAEHQRDTIRGERDECRRLLQEAKEELRGHIRGGHGGHRVSEITPPSHLVNTAPAPSEIQARPEGVSGPSSQGEA